MAKQTYPPGTVLMRPMLDDLARNWWLVLSRGIGAILFGLLTIMWPGLTLLTLVLLFGVFALFDGGLALGAAIMGGSAEPRWWLALVGLLGIAAGALALLWPGITGLVLLIFIAAWAITAGVFEIMGAIKLRKEIEGGVVAHRHRHSVCSIWVSDPAVPRCRRTRHRLRHRLVCDPVRGAARRLLVAAEEACGDQDLTALG